MGFESLDFVYHPSRDFRTPGGQRIAAYQLTRPGAAASFQGRKDF